MIFRDREPRRVLRQWWDKNCLLKTVLMMWLQGSEWFELEAADYSLGALTARGLEQDIGKALSVTRKQAKRRWRQERLSGAEGVMRPQARFCPAPTPL